jgi:hypothetical protein
VFLPSHRLRSWGPLEGCSASGRATTDATPSGDTLARSFLAGRSRLSLSATAVPPQGEPPAPAPNCGRYAADGGDGHPVIHRARPFPRTYDEPDDAGDRILTRVRSVLLDLGGVLETGCWPGLAEAWAPRLGITTQPMPAAVFGGSDETVLAGRMSEDDWWQQQVLPRLGISRTALGRLRADIALRWRWDERLLGRVAQLGRQMRTAIVSNA